MDMDKCAFCHSYIDGEYERFDDGDVCCIPCYLTESDIGD